MDKQHLQELVKSVDPRQQLDDDVEKFLLLDADGYMDDLVSGASVVASHRKSNTIEPKDIQAHLGRKCNMRIPGFGKEELIRMKWVPEVSEAHKQRLALMKETIKKH